MLIRPGYCHCGCGKPTAPGSSYVRGHYSRSAAHKAQTSALTKRRWEDPAYRARQTASAKRHASDPAFREHMSAALTAPQIRKRLSAAMKKRWRDPMTRPMMMAGMSERAKALWEDPAYRENIITKVRATKSTPEYRAKHGSNGYFHKEKGRWKVYVNGKSMYRARYVMELLLGRPLTREEVVHHINEVKDDDRPENLLLFPNQEAHSAYHNMLRTFKLKRPAGWYGAQGPFQQPDDLKERTAIHRGVIYAAAV